MQAPIRGLTESSGEVFSLDILSHRMSASAPISTTTRVAKTLYGSFRLTTPSSARLSIAGYHSGSEINGGKSLLGRFTAASGLSQ